MLTKQQLFIFIRRVTYGEWEPSDYDMMGNIIPQVQNILGWGGATVAVIGLVAFFLTRKSDPVPPAAEVDVDALMEKYLNEDRHEDIFGDA